MYVLLSKGTVLYDIINLEIWNNQEDKKKRNQVRLFHPLKHYIVIEFYKISKIVDEHEYTVKTIRSAHYSIIYKQIR